MVSAAIHKKDVQISFNYHADGTILIRVQALTELDILLVNKLRYGYIRIVSDATQMLGFLHFKSFKNIGNVP